MKLLEKIITVSLFVLSALIIFLVCYLFGWDLLSSYLVGNDVAMAYTAALWYEKYFPFIPQWFPLQGSGTMLSQGVIGAPVLAVLLSKITGMSVASVMHLWELLSVYLTALGIFVFVRVKFKSWTAALLAGIFYPLSNVSWAWMTEIGTYAQSVAFIFIAPAILSLDLFLSEYFSGKRLTRLALWFVMATLMTSSAIMTHVLAGSTLLGAMVIYALIFSFTQSGKKIKNLLKGLLSATAVIGTALVLAGFWIFPYLRYSLIASRNVTPAWSFEQLPYITLSALFGFSGLDSLSQNNAMWYVFFSRPIWILAILGLVMAILKKEKSLIAASMVSLFFIFYAIAPGVVPWLVKPLLIFWREIYIRGLIPAIIFLPVLAAGGCLLLGQTMAKLIPKLNLTPVFTLIIACGVLFFLNGAPPNKEQMPCYQGFGRWWRTEVNYCRFFDKLGHFNLEINPLAAPFGSLTSQILTKLDLSPSTRVDISPRRGALIATWSSISNAPIAPLYWYAMALNWKYLGFQEGVFYEKTDVEKHEAIPELAYWFGIKYVLLHRDESTVARDNNTTDDFERLDNDYWQRVDYDSGNSLEIKQFKNSQGMATWTNRPVFLVVGPLKRQAYEEVFRKAVSGAISYQNALIVEGRDDGRLDKYSPEELKKFDGLILYGQNYQDREKVNKLLSDYVKGGGRIFIETGWQYVNSEWQAHKALDIIPLERYFWEKSPTNTTALHTELLGKNYDVNQFGKFNYYDDTWNVATAEMSDVRSWGQVLYERNGKPIMVAGQYGQGKVVWSGLNLIGHLHYYHTPEEYDFTNHLFQWLLSDKDNKNLKLSFTRPNPDKIEFTIKEDYAGYSWLLWRENYYPDWQASVNNKNLASYRVGPNLTLIRVPPIRDGEKITLQLKLSWVLLVSKIFSLVTLITLVAMVIYPQTLIFLTAIIKNLFMRFSKSVLEDNEQ